MKKKFLLFISLAPYSVPFSFYQLEEKEHEFSGHPILTYENINFFPAFQSYTFNSNTGQFFLTNATFENLIQDAKKYFSTFQSQIPKEVYDQYLSYLDSHQKEFEKFVYYNCGTIPNYTSIYKETKTSDGIWICNQINQVILKKDDLSVDLQDALTQYFQSNIHQHEKSLQLLEKSKILALLSLIPNKKDNTQSLFLIGLAKNNKDQLFYWFTDLNTDISVLMQYANKNTGYYNKLCSIFKYCANLPMRMAQEHYEREYKLD